MAARVLRAPIGWLATATGTAVLCDACGAPTRLQQKRTILGDELVREWGLSKEWAALVEKREAIVCARCGSSGRARFLARSIVKLAERELGVINVPGLLQLCEAKPFRTWRIAEINSAGQLHPILAHHPHVAYSEYQSRWAAVPSEDLSALTYAEGSFDLVITSEVLEHVPDVSLAFKEILRVLRPGGFHLFTVPHVTGRPTRQRARIRDGKVEHLFPPTFHGAGQSDMLVFCEPGDDFADICSAAGFNVSIESDPINPAIATFVTQRPR